MPRPLMTDKKLIPKTVIVHPDEWKAFLQLMNDRGMTASSRIRKYIQADLRKARRERNA